MKKYSILVKNTALAFVAHLALSSSLLAQDAAAPAASPQSGLQMLFPLLIILPIFYFLIIRPQQRQAKLRQEMLKNVAKGDQVVTVGGILGRVVGVSDEVLTVEIADNCKVKMERSGIQSVKVDKETKEVAKK